MLTVGNDRIREVKSMIDWEKGPARRILAFVLLLAGLALLPSLALATGPPDFKPGYNFYSPQEDVQVGKENSAQVDRQLPLLNDPEATKYLNSLGRRLVALAPNLSAALAAGRTRGGVSEGVKPPTPRAVDEPEVAVAGRGHD